MLEWSHSNVSCWCLCGEKRCNARFSFLPLCSVVLFSLVSLQPLWIGSSGFADSGRMRFSLRVRLLSEPFQRYSRESFGGNGKLRLPGHFINSRLLFDHGHVGGGGACAGGGGDGAGAGDVLTLFLYPFKSNITVLSASMASPVQLQTTRYKFIPSCP